MRAAGAATKMMNFKKKLQNPFALVAQGFAIGAVLVFATTPKEADLAQPQPVESAALVDAVDA